MAELKNSGSFRKTKTGSIEYRVPYYDAKGARRIKSFTGETEEDCMNRAAVFLMENETKLIRLLPDATIADICRQKIENEYTKNYYSEATYDRNLQAVRIIERGLLGNVPIRDIKELQLEKYIEEITRYAPSVLRRIFSFISTAYKMAYDSGIIKNNIIVTKQIKCPRSSKPSKEIRGMTEEEQKRFVEALENHKVPYGRNTYKIQLLLELYTGMRMGEINALKPEDINFKDGYVHVEATISRGINSRSYYKQQPKTAAGVRDVPLTEKSKSLLRQAVDEMIANPEGLIFYDHNKNDVVSTYQVGKFFERICAKAKVPYYGQHALRHTFATRCIEAGVPAVVLKKWLGHTDIHITLDTYSDVFERMNNEAISIYDSYIEKVTEELFEYIA